MKAPRKAYRKSRRAWWIEPDPVPDARWVYLGSGHFALVDAADFETVMSRRWSHSNGYAQSRTGGESLYLHRWLTSAGHNDVVDHANGLRWDNRRCNLRVGTQQTNMRNVGKVAGVVPFKGVSRRPHASLPFVAKICIGRGRYLTLGRFSSATEAAHAYDEAAREHFGEYARVNFPRPGERGAIEPK